MRKLDPDVLRSINLQLDADHGQLYTVTVLSIQVVKKGFIAIYDLKPKPMSADMLGEWERLGFFHWDEKARCLRHKSDIILG